VIRDVGIGILNKPKIIVAGHLCLDLHPDLKQIPSEALITPGKVFEIGKLDIGTGGTVSNTGITLHKLGVETSLLSCVGDDMVGQMILEKIKIHNPKLIENIYQLEKQSGSYTMVFSPGNQDRTLIHYPGTNEIFGIQHLRLDIIKDAKIFHLGYPPLLPRLILNEGHELEMMFLSVKEKGVITSLDLSFPDPTGNTFEANWLKILKRVLPHIDVFIPSIEEIIFMLRKSDYEKWNGSILPNLSKGYLKDLAFEILEIGVAITGFKLGDMGMYLQASTAENVFQNLKTIIETNKWKGIQMWHPAFQVEVKGCTGAGDSAYAGFLTELLMGSEPLHALKMSCAVGACNVEATDSVSGILSRNETLQRIEKGWALSSKKIPFR
jgi:sugar/nucleoside kinase (ribokinase family)